MGSLLNLVSIIDMSINLDGVCMFLAWLCHARPNLPCTFCNHLFTCLDIMFDKGNFKTRLVPPCMLDMPSLGSMFFSQ